MAEYVVVDGGQIVEYHGDLPQSWRNVSGLNMLRGDVEFLKSLGWYSVRKVEVPYNPETHRHTGYNYQIFDQYVEETPVIEAIPAGEIPTFEYKKQQFMNYLRGARNEKLRDSDWTQLADCVLSEEEKTKWRVYRQALRDLPSNYEGNSSLAIEEEDWPTL